jgi:hypothetical protein
MEVAFGDPVAPAVVGSCPAALIEQQQLATFDDDRRMAVFARFREVQHRSKGSIRALNLIGHGEEDTLAASARSVWQEAGGI